MVSVPVGNNEGHGNGCGDVVVVGGGNNSSGSSGGSGSGRNLAFLFGGCLGDGTRAAPDEAFVLDLSGGAAAGGEGGCDGLADEEGGGQGTSGEDSQVGWTLHIPVGSGRTCENTKKKTPPPPLGDHVYTDTGFWDSSATDKLNQRGRPALLANTSKVPLFPLVLPSPSPQPDPTPCPLSVVV